MILKFEGSENEDEVFTLDATYHNGVVLQRWNTIREYLYQGGNQNKAFYEQIVYRRLVGERTDPMLDNLDVFLKEAIGRSYGISTSKLLFQRNTVKLHSSGTL